MTLYVRISTPSRSATARVSAFGRTLKPRTIPPEAEASIDVVLGDPADALVDDVDPHLGVLDLRQLADDRLDRALDVALDDEVEVLDLAGLQLLEQVLERDARGRPDRELLAAQALGALLREIAGVAVVLDHPGELAGRRRLVEAEDLDRVARLRVLAASRPCSCGAPGPCPRRRRRRPRRRP